VKDGEQSTVYGRWNFFIVEQASYASSMLGLKKARDIL
jgi:hypothetical protein